MKLIVIVEVVALLIVICAVALAGVRLVELAGGFGG